MQKFILVLSRAAAILLLSSFLFAAQAQIRTEQQIEVYARKIDKFVELHKDAAVSFADISSYNDAGEEWKRIGSWAELDKFTDDNPTYNMSLTWKRDNKIAAVNFTYSSPSGDWMTYVNHVYRRDGTLALVTSKLRTFMNECVVTQKFYFDQKGNRIKTKVIYSDLESGKPKKPCLGAETIKFTYYKSVWKLPFVKLLAG